MADNQHAKLIRAFLDEVCDRADHHSALRWSEWVRRSVGVTVAFGLSATLASCSGSTTTMDDTGGGGEAGEVHGRPAILGPTMPRWGPRSEADRPQHIRRVLLL